MKLYEVNAEDFYGPEPFSTDSNIARCAKPMRELIDRYDIKRKSVLSIGPGSAHEEYQFLIYGQCTLTLVDIDEYGSLAPRLELLANASAAGPRIRYYIGDFREVRNDRDLAQIPLQDLIYVSSFTPDELRRDALARPRFRYLQYLLSPFNPHWPWWYFRTVPFHPVIEEAANRFLKPGGLLIVQSYTGGPDVTCNPQYFKACQRQMSRNEIDLFEVWCFARTPTIILYVMRKRGGAADFQLGAPLTSFHGRAQLHDHAVRVLPREHTRVR